MTKRDPYRPEPPFEYECTECGSRVRAEQHPVKCDDCGGAVQDVSVPRE